MYRAIFVTEPTMPSTSILYFFCNSRIAVCAFLSYAGVILIEKKAQNKRVILIIDEAQNLEKSVLEQIRMLSNLETTTSKLIQIILVGQPELGEKLHSFELRQLSQRVSLSYHLAPLKKKETREYIKYRMNKASRKQLDIFTWGAIHAIHKFSKGIPRLINIACDRSLLTGYGQGSPKVTWRIARQAIDELSSHSYLKANWFAGFPARAVLPALAGLALILTLGYFQFHKGSAPAFEPRETALSRQQQHPVITKAKKRSASRLETATVAAGTPKRENASLPQVKKSRLANHINLSANALREVIKHYETNRSRKDAVKAAVLLWNEESNIHPTLSSLDNNLAYFRLAAQQNGLQALPIDWDIDRVKQLNLPVILELYDTEASRPVYFPLVEISGPVIILDGKSSPQKALFAIEEKTLESFWKGTGYILWNNFCSLPEITPTAYPQEPIISLKLLLNKIGFQNLKMTPAYDKNAQTAIRELQKKYNIEVDGIVGSVTKMALYIESNSFEIPHIISTRK